jgi:hypothetical protein
MRKPSPAQEALTEAIARLPSASAKVIARLQALAGAGEPLDVLTTLPLIWKTGHWETVTGRISAFERLFRLNRAARIPGEVSAAAHAAIRQLLGRLSPQELPAFDLAIRGLGKGPWLIAPGPTSANWVAAPAPGELAPDPSRTGLLGLLASHADGYVREAAVTALAKVPGPEALPFLLWRMGDWVAEVRGKALAAVRARMTDENAAAFARLLPLIDRLEALKRIDLAALVAEIRALLIDEPRQMSLVTALREGDRHLRRAACRVLDRIAPAPPKPVRDLALADEDALVRGWLIAWAERLHASQPDESASLLAALSRDAAPRIRYQAKSAMLSRGDPDAWERLRETLFDGSAALRSLAQFHLRQKESGIDLASVYRRAIESGTGPIAPAIAGLGETGAPADVPAVLQFLGGPSRQARAGLQAAAALDPTASRGAILAALADRRAGICRKALSLLEKRLAAEDAETLAGLWARSVHPASRSALADAMLRLPPWPAALTLLRAVANGPAEASAIAADALVRWSPEHLRAHAPLPPEPNLAQQLDEAYRAGKPLLSTATRERMEKALRPESTP